MATDLTRPRKKRHITDDSDDPTTAEAGERETKMIKSYAARDEILRNLITCKICFKPLYEPFTNECGHTYCYTCLCQWFKNSPTRRKTCPDCRKKLSQPPTPAFAIKELTEEMIKRPELLPTDETVEAHETARMEESDIVEKDRAKEPQSNGGLFDGCFKHQLSRSSRMRDDEDGVYRCPECAWELEGQHDHCFHCGAIFILSDVEIGSVSFSSEDDDEVDGDLLDRDEEFDQSMAAWGDEGGYSDGDASSRTSEESEIDRALRRLADERRRIDAHVAQTANYHRPNDDGDRVEGGPDDEDSDDDEDDEDEDDESLEGFIVDDENDGGNIGTDASDNNDSERADYASASESDSTTSTARQLGNSRIRNRPRRIVIDSDDDDQEELQATEEPTSHVDSTQASSITSTSSDASSNSTSPVAPRQLQTPQIYSSDFDSSEDSDDSEQPVRRAVRLRGG